MPESHKPTAPRRLSEVEAHQLLARAAELDARLSTSVSAEQLWSAAREAGISEEALAQATAELNAGKLFSPTRGAAIATAIGTLGKVSIALVVFFAAVRDARYPLAQLVAFALGVYGAYDVLNRLQRWTGKRRAKRAHQQMEVSTDLDKTSSDEHMSMSVRLFSAPASANGSV